MLYIIYIAFVLEKTELVLNIFLICKHAKLFVESLKRPRNSRIYIYIFRFSKYVKKNPFFSHQPIWAKTSRLFLSSVGIVALAKRLSKLPDQEVSWLTSWLISTQCAHGPVILATERTFITRYQFILLIKHIFDIFITLFSHGGLNIRHV